MNSIFKPTAFIHCLVGSIGLIITCSAAHAAAAKTPVAASFLKEIKSLDRQGEELVRAGNYAALVRLEAQYEMPIFTVTYANGRILNAAQNRKFQLYAHAHQTIINQLSRQIVSITPKYSDYIVEYTEQHSGTYRSSGESSSQPYTSTVRVREYWVKQGIEWKLGGAEELAKTQKYDGRTYSVSAQSGLSF